jgi:hypothetical protein
VSDSEKNPGPDDPAYYAPRRLRDIGAAVDKNWRAPTHQDRPAAPAPQLPAHVPPPDVRLSREGDRRGRSDAFNEALAKVLREQLEAEQAGGFAEVRRSSFRALASFAFAGATAALVALTCFALISRAVWSMSSWGLGSASTSPTRARRSPSRACPMAPSCPRAHGKAPLNGGCARRTSRTPESCRRSISSAT